MNARDWLVAQGLAKPGRGKFSNEAKSRLSDSGLTFDDWPKDNTPKPPKERKVKAKQSDTYEIAAPFWPTDAKFYAAVNGKEISSNAVDRGCGHSLLWCHCEKPIVSSKYGETEVYNSFSI